MSETERPKLANLVSVVFIIAALAVLILAYVFFLKPLTTGPNIGRSLSAYSSILALTILVMPDLLISFLGGIFVSSELTFQMSTSLNLFFLVFSIIMVVVLIVSAFGYAYRKKWGYYLTIISSVFLIITPILGYVLSFPIIYVVGSVFFAILGILFLLHLRGDVKKEF